MFVFWRGPVYQKRKVFVFGFCMCFGAYVCVGFKVLNGCDCYVYSLIRRIQWEFSQWQEKGFVFWSLQPVILARFWLACTVSVSFSFFYPLFISIFLFLKLGACSIAMFRIIRSGVAASTHGCKH
jgi:hypothetical protein